MVLATEAYNTQDEGKGVVRLHWANIRERVYTANPEFCTLVDEVDPGEEFAFYIAYYPYGTIIADDKTTFIPTLHGEYLPLNQPNPKLDAILVEDLSYGANSAPLCMLLNKSVELFIDRKDEHLTLPCQILHAGDFISNKQVLNTVETNTILHTAAGCRSAVMLPPISCSRHFGYIQKEFGMSTRKPETLYQHGQLFAELAQHSESGCEWSMAVLFFSHKFIQKMKTDLAWHKLKAYFYHYAIRHYLDKFDLETFMDITLSDAQRKRNLKIDPFIADTSCHLHKIAAGLAPGFAPASDETHLPRTFLQQLFVEVYGLTQYYPTILHPRNFNLNDSSAQAVYYSRQYPTSFASSPKTRSTASITYELGELAYCLDELHIGLSLLAPDLNNALWLKISKTVEFSIYHSHNNREKKIKLSGCIPRVDARFGQAGCAIPLEGRELSDEGAFARGCIAISLRQ